MASEHLRRQWEALADGYQASVTISADDVHYGPAGPAESQLGLLGDVRGARILELGCGGGHNSVALAKKGAHVTGLDFSARQLEYARRLAAAHDASVDFLLADLEQPPRFAKRSFDIALTSFAVEYVQDLAGLCRFIIEILRPGGIFVLCDLHPFASSANVVGASLPGVIESVNYFGNDTVGFQWTVDSPSGRCSIPLVRYHRTVSGYLQGLLRAGFVIKDVVEPELFRQGSDEARRASYQDRTIEAQRPVWEKLPYTFIVVGAKPEG